MKLPARFGGKTRAPERQKMSCLTVNRSSMLPFVVSCANPHGNPACGFPKRSGWTLFWASPRTNDTARPTSFCKTQAHWTAGPYLSRPTRSGTAATNGECLVPRQSGTARKASSLSRPRVRLAGIPAQCTRREPNGRPTPCRVIGQSDRQRRLNSRNGKRR